jgi:hypothetical protein
VKDAGEAIGDTASGLKKTVSGWFS